PYTGSGVLASALAIDKIRSKAIYRDAGIPTPEFITLTADADAATRERAMASFPLPVVVKPCREGSTIGITIVRERARMLPALDLAFRYDAEALVERFIAGVEITGAVLGNGKPRALSLVEIVPRSGFYDYEMKYTPGATEEIVPARIPAEATARAKELATAAHHALGCRGMSRTDMIVAEDGIWVLETNTIPGMTETSLLPRAAAADGIPFPALVEMLIEFALE
ncbi:MAG: D-alanine--D-alanine ligase, partial [Armatimonadetes bacterium]|nr:D-alanine--D-alanine ligase [Armatimonadota bacterium]